MALRLQVDTRDVTIGATRLRRVASRMRRDMEAAVADAQEAAEQVAKRHAPVHTGRLLNSIQTEGPSIRQDAGGLTVTGVVHATAPYAVVMEEGRRPGKMPPRAPIERWVRLRVRRGDIRLRPATRRHRGDRRRANQTSSGEAQIRSLTYLVRRKIAREGIRPRRYMVRAETVAKSRLYHRMAALQNEWAREAER